MPLRVERKKMKIKFIEVGRNNASWESECPANNIEEMEYDWFYSQVKKRAMVMSTDLDFLLNKENNTDGIITAGFHTIGKFQIVK